MPGVRKSTREKKPRVTLLRKLGLAVGITTAHSTRRSPGSTRRSRKTTKTTKSRRKATPRRAPAL